MIASKKGDCPYCGRCDLHHLGKLPDSYWFAGNTLAAPLPGGWLYRCKNCKLKFRNPACNPTAYEKLYDNSVVNNWSADTTRRDWELISSYISNEIPEGSRILDFGCYTGGLLARLGTRYERHGVEINAAAAAIVDHYGRGKTWRDLKEIPDSTLFDVIIACDVIEHMADPGNFLTSMSKKLAKGGIIIVTTGDADNRLWDKFGANWWYCFYPEHISFISASWLGNFLRHSDLELKVCRTFRYRQLSIVRYTIDLILTYFYGFLPTIYIKAVGLLRKTRGVASTESVAGNGITADHLFIALTKSKRGNVPG